MELAEAIKVVREFHAWRRGGNDPMPYPRTTGEALGALCCYAERLDRDLESCQVSEAALIAEIAMLKARDTAP